MGIDEYKIGLIEGTVTALAKSFEEHREEERAAWKEIRADISELKSFKSKVLAVATFAGTLAGMGVTIAAKYFFN